MRVGLITTLDTNIGDDFIRLGLIAVLKEVAGQAIDFVSVNKHFPLSALPAGHPAIMLDHLPGPLYRIRNLAASIPGWRFNHSVFDDCDMLLQCGAPVLWQGVGVGAEMKILWRKIISKFADSGRPILNLAGGSAFKWQARETVTLDPPDLDFARYIGNLTTRITVRDELCQRLFRAAGFEFELVACSALLAAQTFMPPPAAAGDVVMLNYMHGGGHYNLGQEIDAGEWRATFLELIGRLGKRHKLALICHNEAEAKAARELGADVTIILPKSHAEYFELAARAKGGVFNRMHASVAFAGFGIPSVAVGNDTRLLMVANCGLPAHFTSDVTAAGLEAEIEGLLAEGAAQRARLLALREVTWNRYAAIFRETLGR